MAPASTRPTYSPASAKAARARSSPARAAVAAPSTLSRPAAAAIASAPAIRSRQPRLPQPQSGPSGSTAV
jgi:hypothetical protein